MSIYDHLEFKHFKYIVAIAEAGTFTAAAIHLPLAQSALSRQISEMEDALGVHIFDRSRGGSTLTEAGESLLRFHEDKKGVSNESFYRWVCAVSDGTASSRRSFTWIEGYKNDSKVAFADKQ